MAFKRRMGERDVRVFPSAGTIAANDLVQFDENGEVVVAATNKDIVGIALEAATSSTNVHVDVLKDDHEVEATVSTGSMAAAEIGEEADLEDENSLTLTESNNDFLITGWDGVSTGLCYGRLKYLAFGTATTVKP
jgi:hypothetical protein